MRARLRHELAQLGLEARARLATWLLRGVTVEGMVRFADARFGRNSITISPPGAGDVVRWSGSQPALVPGDIGMDVATGRASIRAGGQDTQLAIVASRSYTLALETFKRQGASAPPETSLGTSPVVGGLLFDTTARAIGFGYKISENTLGTSFTLEIPSVLTQVEVAGNLIEWVLDYVVVRNSASGFGNGDGGAVVKTSTQLSSSIAVQAGTASAGLQVGVTYHVPFSIQSSDAQNPWTATGDYVFYGELRRVTVGGAGKAGNIMVTSPHVTFSGD